MPYAKTAEAIASFREIIAVRAREPNGRMQRPTTGEGRREHARAKDEESAEQAMRVALGQPHRRALPKTRKDDDGRNVEIDRSDRRAGFALGRIFLHGNISRDQLIAGQRYTELALRHMHHITGHLPKFPSQAINDTIKGLDCSADMPEEEVFKLRRGFQDAQRALFDTCEHQACSAALMSVCIMDREPSGERELGSLRVGLNALHRLWA